MTESGWWAACHALSIAFANGIDHWRNEEVLALFTEDGTPDRWGQAIIGQAALRQWLEQRPVDVVTRHVCTNFEARQTVPNRVQGLTLFTFYTAPKSNGMDPVAFRGPQSG